VSEATRVVDLMMAIEDHNKKGYTPM